MDTSSELLAKCLLCGARYCNPGAVKNHFYTVKSRHDSVHTGRWDNSIAELVIDDECLADPVDQLRSSRSTRNAEHNAPSRNRAGVFDYDPTDGLPVRKYVLETVKINQDASSDPYDAGNESTATKESDFPWPELPLPSFFDSLPPHNQALIRRARMGDRDREPSIWDKRREEWVRPGEAKAKGLGESMMKSRHLRNIDLDQDQDDGDDEDGDEASGDDEFGMTGLVTSGNTAHKKRKLATGPEERTMEIKKWVQLSMDKADKMAEPKFLADRRPGMGSLFTPAYMKSVTAYGSGVDAVATQAGAFDLGDGGGLGNALGGGGVAAPMASGEATPRKNMPPKRKKKKLGGPGRRKAVPVDESAGVAAGEAANREVKEGEVGEKGLNEDGEGRKEGEDGGEDGEEGSVEESEEEGSEEGEVSEEVAAPTAAPTAPPTAAPTAPPTAAPTAAPAATPVAPAPVPEVNVEELKEGVKDVVEEGEDKMEEAAPPEATNEVVEEEKEVEGEVKMDLLGSVEAAVEGMEKEE
jgi:hypothetical protein